MERGKESKTERQEILARLFDRMHGRRKSCFFSPQMYISGWRNNGTDWNGGAGPLRKGWDVFSINCMTFQVAFDKLCLMLLTLLAVWERRFIPKALRNIKCIIDGALGR